MDVQIRAIDVSDAEAAAELSAELGYPVPVSVMEERIRNLAALDAREVFVACRANVVVGWIDIGVVHHLQAETCGEIGGLVVSSACRSIGIGALLVSHAEVWVGARGLRRVIVRSQVAREAAHRFYLRAGYERTKTSAVFSKTLAPAQS
jgi:PhnO protein